MRAPRDQPMRPRPMRGDAVRQDVAGGPDFSRNTPAGQTPSRPASSAPEPAPVVDRADPSAIWQAVLAGAATDAANRWLRDLRLIRLDGDQAIFAILPAARPRASYIRSKQPDLARRLSAAIGSAVRVRIDEEASRADQADEAASDRRGPDAGPGGRQRLTDAERDAAARLPLVSRIIEQFNAAIVDVHDESPLTRGPSSDDESADTDGDEDQ